jgi:catechol 2,3-dioxygenase-like lactoylglutathione lyase family enzyme
VLKTPPTTVGIHHIQIEAPPGCEEAARTFYGGILGLDEMEKPEQLRSRTGVWFACGPQQIHIGVTNNFEPRRKGHPALEVQNLSAWRIRLIAFNIALTEDEPLPGWSRFYIADPWGNRIELLERAEQ